MDERRPTNPRRRKRTKAEVFKEAYLPAVIVCVALILILIFIIGSIARGIAHIQYNAEQNKQASISAEEEKERLTLEAGNLLSQAADAASHFDYSNAISILESFTGNMKDYPELSQAHAKYTDAISKLVLWNDPQKVLNLSFHVLVADTDRAFTDDTYSTSYDNNFVTVTEFSKILQQLYANDYILVRLSDVAAPSGAKELYLPEGKKPLIITQTNVNYYTYMVDGDGDKLPDKDGAGFASKLILDANGNISCEMVDADGKTVNGAYDMVPILESFIETHPDFSYKNARAVLAVSGYNGIFGYRIDSASREYFGKAYHDQQVTEAKQLVAKLDSLGYELACYSYYNESYGNYTAEQIRDELKLWQNEIAPVLGERDIFVFHRETDIAPIATPYSGDKFAALNALGFGYYLGICENSTKWYSEHSDYIRMGRVMVTGSNLSSHADWFKGILDPSAILDPYRKAK